MYGVASSFKFVPHIGHITLGARHRPRQIIHSELMDSQVDPQFRYHLDSFN